jgi:hypothetical protein
MIDEFMAPLIAEVSLRTIVSGVSLAIRHIATDPGKPTLSGFNPRRSRFGSYRGIASRDAGRKTCLFDAQGRRARLPQEAKRGLPIYATLLLL